MKNKTVALSDIAKAKTFKLQTNKNYINTPLIKQDIRNRSIHSIGLSTILDISMSSINNHQNNMKESNYGSKIHNKYNKISLLQQQLGEVVKEMRLKRQKIQEKQIYLKSMQYDHPKPRLYDDKLIRKQNDLKNELKSQIFRMKLSNFCEKISSVSASITLREIQKYLLVRIFIKHNNKLFLQKHFSNWKRYTKQCSEKQQMVSLIRQKIKARRNIIKNI